MRILMYSSGMGGACSTLAIASHLAELSTTTSFLVLTDLPVFGRFRLPPNLDYIHIPRLPGGVASSEEPTSRFMSDESALAIRGGLLAATIESYDPHLVIVDRKPLGIANELEEPLYALRERRPRTRIIAGLWDVSGASHTTLDRDGEGVCDALRALFDEIWLYGTPELYTARLSGSMDPELVERLHFTGYLRHSTDADGARHKLASEGIDLDLPLVLVTVGSGRNGHCVVDEYLNFIERGLPYDAAAFQTHIVCGPMMSTAEKKALDERVALLESVTIDRFHKDLTPYVHAASVVVSTAGYNTCCQILSFKKRAVVVPRRGENGEQIIRAEFLSGRGLVEMIHPEDLSSNLLGEKVIEQLRESVDEHDPEKYRSINLDGLENIAKRVIEHASTFTR